MVDTYSRSKRSEIMGRIKGRRTQPEEAVAGILRELGLGYRRTMGNLPGRPDFAIRGRKAVVFVHGCFWHRHRNCRRASVPATNKKFWLAKFQQNVRRDRRNARKLRQMGYRVIVVWQCRLRNRERVKRRLARLLTTE